MTSPRSTLILDSLPQQGFFSELTDVFQSDPRIDQIIQRGSFAKQRSDRASDIDLLLVVQDQSIQCLLEDLDAIIGEHCNMVAPHGWVDTIVPDFGGIGFVYLIEFNERLIQLDIYITPSSWAQKINDFPEKAVMHTRHGYVPSYTKLQAPKRHIKTFCKTLDKEYQYLFEFLLLIVMLIKHIYRSHPTLAVKYRYAAIESLAVCMRLVYTPDRIDYKMYDWEYDFKDVSAAVVKSFERSISHIDIYNPHEVTDLLQMFKTVVYEGRLNARYAEFKPLIDEIQRYADCLLSPEY